MVSQEARMGYWSELRKRLSQQLREGGAHSGWETRKSSRKRGAEEEGCPEGPLALRC